MKNFLILSLAILFSCITINARADEQSDAYDARVITLAHREAAYSAYDAAMAEQDTAFQLWEMCRDLGASTEMLATGNNWFSTGTTMLVYAWELKEDGDKSLLVGDNHLLEGRFLQAKIAYDKAKGYYETTLTVNTVNCSNLSKNRYINASSEFMFVLAILMGDMNY